MKKNSSKRPSKIKFLLNANVSPLTAKFLREKGFDVVCILEENLGEIGDEEVVRLAKSDDRIIITSDLDFGLIFHKKEKGKIGVVILRLHSQTVESVNRALERFLKSGADFSKLAESLVIVTETIHRIYKDENKLRSQN